MKHRGRFGLRKTGPNTRGRTTECLGKPDCIADLAEFAAGIVADTRSLRDHVTDLENDGIELRELRAIVDAADSCMQALVRWHASWPP